MAATAAKDAIRILVGVIDAIHVCVISVYKKKTRKKENGSKQMKGVEDDLLKRRIDDHTFTTIVKGHQTIKKTK